MEVNSLAKVPFVREATGFVREYGALMVIMMAMNNMIGAGIYALTVRAPYTYPGSDMALAFIIAFFPVLFICLSYAWLGASMPRAGGDYVFMSRVLNPALGYAVTFGQFIARFFSVGFLLYTDVKLWGLAFLLTGTAAKIDWLASFGTYLMVDVAAAIVGGILLLLTVWAFLIKGGRTFTYYIFIVWLIPFIGGILMMIYHMLNPFEPMKFKMLWDATWGAGAYAEILSVTEATGWKVVPFSWDATMFAVIFALFAYSGFHNPAQWAGEVKNPRKSLIMGLVAATLITAFYYIGLAATVYYACGDFIYRYNWAYYKARAMLKINPVVEPVMPLFSAIFVGGNPVLAILFAMAGAMALYHVQPAALMMDTRRLFSIAFDRFFPERFTEVSERFHTPIWAITFFLVGGIIGILLASPLLGPLYPIFAGISATFMYLLAYCFTGLALVMVPLLRPEIYEAIKWEVRGISIPQVIGVLAFTTSIIFFAIAAQTLSTFHIAISSVVLGLALLSFIYYSIKNTKAGIDVKTIYYEVPPE